MRIVAVGWPGPPAAQVLVARSLWRSHSAPAAWPPALCSEPPPSCCGEVGNLPPHIPPEKRGKWRCCLEIFPQIFFHGLDPAEDGAPNGAFVHALLAGDLPIALTENEVGIHPAALELRQGVDGVPEVEKGSLRSRSSWGLGSCSQAEYSIPSSQSRE